MRKPEERTNRKLLRIMYPEVYDRLVEELSLSNIHPYDIQATSQQMDGGAEIQVCFGENYRNEITRSFSAAEITSSSSEFTAFAKDIAEKCKETMFAEYLKMIKM